MIKLLTISLVGLIILISSCTINTNLMLRTHKEYVYEELSDSVIYSAQEYRLAPNDIIQFLLYDNDGYIVLEQGISSTISGSNGNDNTRALVNANRNAIKYLIDKDSTAKLPELRRVKLAGLTLREAEDTLESLYSERYVKPFVQLQVVNKRVIVFPGGGGNARVITLSNNNTTLMEVLATAGGIDTRGNASHIKLMRNVDNIRHVYELDMSTIDGLKYTDMLVQANDYIYVEPVPEIGREIIRDIAPIVSIISSTIIVYTVFRTINN